MTHARQQKIKVKLINRGRAGILCSSQFPGQSHSWGNCEFHFSLTERNYDWLVVIDDISRQHNALPEVLACADEHTLLITSEPPTITHYGNAFTGQFEHVLTSQDEQSLPHRNRLYSHTGNLWFNGHNYGEIQKINFNDKTQKISTVCSSKQQRHTIHKARFEFTDWLKAQIPELEIFGHGVRAIKQKYSALDSFRFHLAIENHIAPHHWTEKLADPFLSGALPIYYGCSNIGDYFPADSYLAIDINKPDEALQKIDELINDPLEYVKRVDALKESQQLVLNEYNLIAMVDRIVSENYTPGRTTSQRPLYGRKQMRIRNPSDLVSHLNWGAKMVLRSWSK